MTEALGFFGSKIVAPTRECWRQQDCETFIEAYKAREQERARKRRDATRPALAAGETAELAAIPEERLRLLVNQKLTYRTCRLVLKHKELEQEYLKTGRWGWGSFLRSITD